ncbi:hypothetical protein TRFO_39675 [Tritrichomonas foetus]|uniref:Nuclear transport factor 2 domain-containing protein n=1 Tax=Tritrichomonas foetus TaxID=1144522 RepID=A0A1J4J7F5_9EUKA|nr:hypothetical protein TRFO_39675 [Tritrichomonas foetus]|eukprot:OHS94143.1 hypothetical protein TRFO_39675 [Tritrichomonas foetus]
MSRGRFPDNRRKNQQFGVAFGPLPSDDPEFSPDPILDVVAEAAKNKNRGKDVNILQKDMPEDKSFIVLSVSTKEESHSFTDLNGTTDLIASSPLLVTSCDFNTWKATETAMASCLPRLVRENVLNLSNLDEHGISINLQLSHNASFVLFLAAIYCISEKLRIKKLIFKGNNINDTQGFYNIKSYFPSLKKLAFPTSVKITDNFKARFQGQVSIVLSDDIETFAPISENYWDKVNFYTIYGPNYVPPDRTEPCTFLTDPDITERSIRYALSMYTPVKLNPAEFPVNQIIIDYYQAAWNSIDSVGRFYHSESVFSVTVDLHGPNSPMIYYDKFSRNLLVQNDKNFAVGSEYIVEAHKELFGDHLYACPTEANGTMLALNLYSYLTHGVFQVNDDIIGFDRTMTIALNLEGQFAILNDHIFIRKANAPDED